MEWNINDFPKTLRLIFSFFINNNTVIFEGNKLWDCKVFIYIFTLTILTIYRNNTCKKRKMIDNIYQKFKVSANIFLALEI